jgi:rhamnosyltransferase
MSTTPAPLSNLHLTSRDGAPVTLSVVIRCRNEARGLRKTFAALRAQKCDFTWEVVLVDNESEDETREIGEQFGARIVPISRQDFTYGGAINLGVSHARGDLVMLLSAHVLPVGSHFLAGAVAPFADPLVAAARCLFMWSPQHIEDWHQPRDIQYHSPEEQRQAESGSKWLADYPWAACCMIRRRAWEEVKFDETIDANEDKLWASQVLAKGYKVRCCAEAVFLYTRDRGRRERWQRENRQHVALYRITGRAPLSWKAYCKVLARAVWSTPGVALRHLTDTIIWNTYLVTIPWQARRAPRIGSLSEFDQQHGVKR